MAESTPDYKKPAFHVGNAVDESGFMKADVFVSRCVRPVETAFVYPGINDQLPFGHSRPNGADNIRAGFNAPVSAKTSAGNLAAAFMAGNK
jgi:hypothetical protein